MTDLFSEAGAVDEVEVFQESITPDSATTVDQDKIRRLLRRWAAEGGQAAVMLGASGTVIGARLREVLDGVARFEVTSGDLGPLLLFTTCVVTLHVDQSSRVFFSSLLRTDARGGVLSLWLQVPRSIAGADGRFTFRVPVLPASGLSASILLGEELRMGVVVHDLSLAGIRIELPGSCPFTLSPQTAVVLRLVRGPLSVDVRATVRRVDGRAYGLIFGELLDERGDLDAPEELIGIVRGLESVWRRERGVT